MNHHMLYELLYIVPTSFTDEDVGAVEGNVKGILEKYGASIVETKRLGKFKLAYPIKKQRHGHYILVKLSAEPQSLAKLDEGLRLSNDVLRHLILREDEAGGETFNLVQFIEVNIEMKDDRSDRPRRRREDGEKPKASEDIKSTAAALDASTTSEKPAVVPALSDEDLDKKLDAAIPNL